MNETTGWLAPWASRPRHAAGLSDLGPRPAPVGWAGWGAPAHRNPAGAIERARCLERSGDSGATPNAGDAASAGLIVNQRAELGQPGLHAFRAAKNSAASGSGLGPRRGRWAVRQAGQPVWAGPEVLLGRSNCDSVNCPSTLAAAHARCPGASGNPVQHVPARPRSSWLSCWCHRCSTGQRPPQLPNWATMPSSARPRHLPFHSKPALLADCADD